MALASGSPPASGSAPASGTAPASGHVFASGTESAASSLLAKLPADPNESDYDAVKSCLRSRRRK